MNKAPLIGTRVMYRGGLCVGPCSGVVTAIYKKHQWTRSGRPTDVLAPERDWSVAVQVDSLPDPWPYTDRDKFAPSASELEIE